MSVIDGTFEKVPDDKFESVWREMVRKMEARTKVSLLTVLRQKQKQESVWREMVRQLKARTKVSLLKALHQEQKQCLLRVIKTLWTCNKQHETRIQDLEQTNKQLETRLKECNDVKLALAGKIF